MQVCVAILEIRMGNSFCRLPVCVVTYTHVLRWAGVFDGFLAAGCRFVSQAQGSWFIIEHHAGEKGKRHCLPNASIMIHRMPKNLQFRPIRLIFRI